MFWLLKKDFEIVILWKNIKYSQLSYYDCLEFYKKITDKDFNIVEWFQEITKSDFSKKELFKIDFEKFLKLYFDTACKWFFKKWNIAGKDSISSFESYLSFLSEKIHLDPLSILKNYTPEQLEIITEWVIFNLNEQTKEWRSINRRKAIQKQNRANPEQNKKDLEEIQRNREKLLQNNK